MEDTVLKAALAGLLHDVGKFAQRAGAGLGDAGDNQTQGVSSYQLAANGFIEKYVPEIWWDSIGEADRLVQAADRLAGVEDQQEAILREEADTSDLVPILTRVSLGGPMMPPAYRFPLAKLDLKSGVVFPVKMSEEGESREKEYEALWKEMLLELDGWKASVGSGWEELRIESYFTTLLAVFRKYTWCIPAASGSRPDPKKQNWPDVSLYDHVRLVSALAACLKAGRISNLEKIRDNQPVALLVRGDLSGIQNFIYRITRPESEATHIAKRLRGRSFYLALLVEVVADWILRELNLPPSCSLFVGGGRFDLLLPINTADISTVGKLPGLLDQLDRWLLDEFHGELSLQVASCELTPFDLKDMRPAYRRLDSQIDIHKKQKWSHFLNDPSFFAPMQQGWHVCSACQLEPLPEPGVCSHCLQQESIGKLLPHTIALAYYYGDQAVHSPTEQTVSFPGSPFKVRIDLILEGDHPGGKNQPDVIYQLNRTDNFIHSSIASSFRFLANEAPLAKQRLHGGGELAAEAGDVLNFEAIAELSTGAKRLGILKADVDRLGFVMGDGLSEDENQAGMRPTLARLASLSSALDLFFAGCLNQICDEVFQSWKQTASHTWLEEEAVTGAFYIIYSGGDDLFVVGPWDAILLLAQRLYAEFKRFSGFNPALSISAGFVQVKPRYPVQKFAELVDEAEKEAKEKGRDRFCLFGEVVSWQNGPSSLTALLALSDELGQRIENHTLPRGILSDLGEVYRQHFRSSSKPSNPMWTPRLYYTLSRRLAPDVFQEIGRKLLDCMGERLILVPVSITSLKTRKE